MKRKIQKNLIPISSPLTTVQAYIHSIYSEGLQFTVAQIFRECAAGINFHAAHSNCYALVELAARSSGCTKTTLINDDYMSQRIRRNAMTIFTIAKGSNLTQTSATIKADELTEFAFNFEQIPFEFNPAYYFEFILKNWDTLKDSTYTYRLLYDLVALSAEWDDGPIDRMEACDMIKSIVGNWRG